ncbi:camp-dependent protein kinase 3 [Helicostylum pulchrum]|uniref:cAMP-dependent protein kinase n=1 Tax=Helicostylum pulchrum TaxID=562976 RepID=A0ABP9YFJ1_9FUNG|nr:camp-dependent protein kinase 3 [Helicostylum pulchrum]
MSTKTIQLMDPYPTPPSIDINHEPFEKITGLPTPKVTPRTSLRREPVYSHKLPDNFFTSCSPPSPISPIASYDSRKNTPLPSPRLHPSFNAQVTTIEALDLNKPPIEIVLPAVLEKNALFQKPKIRMSLDDFDIKQTVGTGSFARVHLAKSKINQKYYAIKAINKKDLVTRQQLAHAQNERLILSSVSHPFVVKLWGTFQSESHVFLVMDYVSGGELFRMIRKQKKFTEEQAKFYAAEVVLAIEYLHSIDIAYRDIKPENILIDQRGHVKLTDFGFAKTVPHKTWTVCGTPDYLAPEIIRSKGYTKAVDWWGLGVLIFEMLTGRPPFVAKNPVDKYQKILECDIVWPKEITQDAKDLIQNLLKTQPAERFEAEQVKAHAWFQSIDFERLLAREVTPPFVPDIKFDGDTRCFDYYEEMILPYHLMHTDKPYCDHFPNF